MRKAYAFISVVAFLLSLSLSWAQSKPGASLSGIVTDQNGAPVPDAAVTVRNIDTGASRPTAPEVGGHFQASALPLGRLEIRAAKQGFADESRTGASFTICLVGPL